MLIAGERTAKGQRIEIYLILHGGTQRAERIACKLLERGWRAEVRAEPTLAIKTTAPPAMFENAWNTCMGRG